MDLDGCAALVTGGSGDIGAAITRALATAGADVAVTYLREKSHARIASAWERRNCDQVGPVRRRVGSMPLVLRISHTVDAATLTSGRPVPRGSCGSPIRGFHGPAGGRGP